MPRKTLQSVCATPPDCPTTLIDRNGDMMRQVEEACRSWAEVTTAPMPGSNEELATRLVACRSAEEALAVYNGWMSAQLDRLVATQHRLIELWCSSIARASAQKGCRSVTQEKL
jgi:hypothetical protein